MSATNRGGERRESDFYPTPAWCVHRFLESCVLPAGMWLEPAVGDGAIVRAVNARTTGIDWTTCDVRPETKADVIADYTSMGGAGLDWTGDVVITNPPFALAMDFIVESMKRAPVVVMLLRLNFLAGGQRSKWMRMHTPSIYVLPNRPSFTGHGTDSIEYAWFVWGLGAARVHILAETAATERR